MEKSEAQTASPPPQNHQSAINSNYVPATYFLRDGNSYAAYTPYTN